MSGNLLEVSDLQVDYLSRQGKIRVINNLSFRLPAGHILGITGESGSGKTTLALALMRLIPVQKVEIKGSALFNADQNTSIDLFNVSDSEMKAVRGKKIAMVFQEPRSAFNPLFTCGNQIAETIRIHQNVSGPESVVAAKEWLAKTNLAEPERIFNSFPHQLSGGQLQRAMIAMALCAKPSLLIADEPLASSDYENHRSLLNLLKSINKESGLSILFISHDLSAIEKVADSVLVLNQGSLVEQGPVADVFHSPEKPYTKMLLSNRIQGNSKPEFTSDNEIKSVNKPPVLTVNNLEKVFRKKSLFSGTVQKETKAISKISFDLYKGETLGITGHSGSGKTTLARCLCGLIDADNGEIVFNRKTVFPDPEKNYSALREGKIQLIFQNPDTSLNPKKTIGEAIGEPLNYYGKRNNTGSTHQEMVKQFMEQAGLETNLYDRYPFQLSGGQKQRVVIIRALIMQPEILICDEAVSSLDVAIQFQILKLLNELKNTFGFSMIFISHDWPVVRYMSDRIMVMENGYIKHIGMAEKVFELMNSEQYVY